MSKLIVELPEEVHAQLKQKATLNRRTLKDIVTSLVEDFLGNKEIKPGAAETGFCGAWEDKRSADEIIKDLKKSRKWLKR